MKKYWYLFIITECPLCGNGEKYKERQYTEKPSDIEDRYYYKQVYDHCEQF